MTDIFFRMHNFSENCSYSIKKMRSVEDEQGERSKGTGRIGGLMTKKKKHKK